MKQPNNEDISRIYEAFNLRDVDTVLQLMHENVHWPNGWEGGYVEGHQGVREYWTRQWQEIDPKVTPISFKEREDGRLEVWVHQVALDKQGNELFNQAVLHVYSFENGLITGMEIEHAK